MRPEDRDAASLWEAHEAAKRIITYVDGLSFEDYMASALRRAAVERELTIIGEALNRLSEPARKAQPHLSIAAIVGLRNRIIHEYERMEHQKIFTIATERVGCPPARTSVHVTPREVLAVPFRWTEVRNTASTKAARGRLCAITSRTSQYLMM